MAVDYDLLRVVAANLGVKSSDLYRLINFESKWNPKASNPLSSAKGLIQFTDKTSVNLGFKSSSDLVKKNPTISDQLRLVEYYLWPMRPFPTKQSLYMAVFYPAARKWAPHKMFPKFIRDSNPGINTPSDYVNKVEGIKPSKISLFVPVVLIAGLYYISKRRKY